MESHNGITAIARHAAITTTAPITTAIKAANAPRRISSLAASVAAGKLDGERFNSTANFSPSIRSLPVTNIASDDFSVLKRINEINAELAATNLESDRSFPPNLGSETTLASTESIAQHHASATARQSEKEIQRQQPVSDNDRQQITFFESVLSDPDAADFAKIKFAPLVKARIRSGSGIPATLRRRIWLWLAGANIRTHAKPVPNFTPNSRFDKIIRQDLGRTFPEHPLFKVENGAGQKSLYNVLTAYANYDDDCGYCQGLSFLIAPLLMQDGMTETEAFAIFVRLMEESGGSSAVDPRRFALRSLFISDMPGLHLILHQHTELLRIYLPALDQSLSVLGITPTMYASQWFLTLFTYSFPLDLVFRIYDLILSEGAVSTLLKFSFAILRRNEPILLATAAQDNGFEECLNILRGENVLKVYMGNIAVLIEDALILDSVISDSNLETFSA
ncbi:hypothetical protein HK100_009525, partial [Physocladia obscura]